MPKSGEELAVRVAVRVRPLVASELQAGANTVVGTDKKSAQAVLGDGRTFAFDFAYGLESTQENIYDDIVKPLEKKVLMGYNATLLAYGQTGSGKTYTMGTAHSDHLEPEHVGVTPRVIRSLFDTIKKEETDELRIIKLGFHFSKFIMNRSTTCSSFRILKMPTKFRKVVKKAVRLYQGKC